MNDSQNERENENVANGEQTEKETVTEQGTDADAREDTVTGDEGNEKLKLSERKRLKKCESEIIELNKKLEEANQALNQEKDKYMRMLAEYDNFRRRSAKEKDGIYTDAYADAVKEILPMIDNLERAVMTIPPELADSGIGKGVTLTLKTAYDALTKMGVTAVETETFDPNVHNAVMHVEDESLAEGAIVEVYQKGYIKGDKVIRCAMVKVAN